MAQLGLGLVGAALGAPFGLSGIGFSLGSALGGALFASGAEDTVQEGARLGDQVSTVSTYGYPIPIGYGTPGWLTGNCIWSKGIEEVRTTTVTEQGGKGGTPSQTNTQVSYSYFNSFAIGLAEGVGEKLLRIKIDEKLVYDITSGAGNALSPGVSFRFYQGTETQLPDSLITAAHGTLAPAHRGLCYIVFDRLALTNYGNRAVPQVKCEVVFVTPTIKTVDPSDFSDISPPINGTTFSAVLDEAAGNLYVMSAHINTGFSISKIDIASTPMSITTSASPGYAFLASPVNRGFFDIGNAGNVYFARTTPTIGNMRLYNHNSSLTYVGEMSIIDEGPPYGNSNPRIKVCVGWYASGSSIKDIVMIHGDPISSGLGDSVFVAGDSVTGSVSKFLIGLASFTNNSFGVFESIQPAMVIPNYGGSSCEFHVFTLGYSYGGVGGGGRGQWINHYLVDVTETTLTKTWNQGSETSLNHLDFDFSTQFTEITAGTGPLYLDPDSGDTIFTMSRAGQTGTPTYIMRITTSGVIKWTTEFDQTGTSGTGKCFPTNETIQQYNKKPLTNNIMYFVIQDKVATLNVATGDITTNLEDWVGRNIYPSSANAPMQLYDETRNCILSFDPDTGIPINVYRGCGLEPPQITVSDTSVPLSDIVADLSGRVGLDLIAPDIVTAPLENILVPGFYATQGPARTPLEQLMKVYQFDIVESDYVLYCILRGASSVLNIPDTELVLLNETGDVVTETRIQEVELPEEVSLKYIEREKEYAPGLQSSRRIFAPTPTMYSRNKVTISTPIVEVVSVMKKASEIILYASWASRSTFTMQTSWCFLKLNPTDVITVSLASGKIFQIRLTNISVSAELGIELEGVLDESAAYVASDILADAGSGILPQTIPPLVRTDLFLLNAPLLRDVDDTGRQFHVQYFAFSSADEEQWPGAALHKSLDTVAYNSVGQSSSPITWGTVTTALPAVTIREFNKTDYVNTFQVDMASGGGELASITWLQMLNGDNAALLVNSVGEIEVIQWQNVVAETNGLYTFDTLLRGRRGTEPFMGGHEVNETIIFLDETAMQKLTNVLTERSAERYYKGVGVNTLLEDAPLETFTFTGADLLPWAPCNVKGVEDVGVGLDINWIRRSRINNEALAVIESGTGLALNEDTEEYELEILAAPGGAVVRTVTGLTSPTYKYLDADQVTDFGATKPVTISVKVYQISAQVGRGHTNETLIDNVALTLSADALAVVAAFDTTPDSGKLFLIERFITELKAAGIWSKLDLLYVGAAHESKAARVNWVDPTPTANLLEVVGCSFTADVGFQSSAKAEYLRAPTGYRWDNLTYFSVSSGHCGAYIMNNTAGDTGLDFGSESGSNGRDIIQFRTGSNTWSTRIGSGSTRVTLQSSITSTLGHWITTKVNATDYEGYRDGVSVGTGSTGYVGTFGFRIKMYDDDYTSGGTYTSRIQGITTMGGHLTATEAADLSAACANYVNGL